MKSRCKVILIAGLSVAVVIVGIFLGPVIYMIVAIQYSGFIISSTDWSDSRSVQCNFNN